MTNIKLCGLTRPCDIQAVNELRPDYIGFVFWSKSRRNLTPDQALELKRLLDPSIRAVGVFVNEEPEIVADYLNRDIIDLAQLHGTEDETYIRTLRKLSEKPLIQAFQIKEPADLSKAVRSSADFILLDSGKGSGTVFDWELIRNIDRPYFLAGGLTIDNVGEAIHTLSPYGVDISSGIETDGKKDKEKMIQFVQNVRANDHSGKEVTL